MRALFKTLHSGYCFAVFASAMLLAFPPLSLAQVENRSTLERALSRRVPEGHVDGTFVEALGRLAHEFGVPMGISWVKTPSSQITRSIGYKNATVLEIIEAVANSEPSYEVAVSNGVVHVATREIPIGQNFLFLKIPEFSAQGFAKSAKFALWMQLNQRISPNPPNGYAANILGSTSETTLDQKFTNATVEEILDFIAVVTEYKVWLIAFEGNLDPTPSGFRRSESLLSAAPPLDDEQPVWEIYQWTFWPLAPLSGTRSTN